MSDLNVSQVSPSWVIQAVPSEAAYPKVNQGVTRVSEGTSQLDLLAVTRRSTAAPAATTRPRKAGAGRRSRCGAAGPPSTRMGLPGLSHATLRRLCGREVDTSADGAARRGRRGAARHHAVHISCRGGATRSVW